jgi:hypothetical protein
MTARMVNTKKELKEAIKDNVDTIIVAEELRKDLKGIIKAMKLSPKKRSAIIGFLGAGGVAVVASVAAAPSTMGISGIAGMSAVAAFAAASGVSIPIIVAIILLCVAIGIPSVVSLIRMYDISEDEVWIVVILWL